MGTQGGGDPDNGTSDGGLSGLPPDWGSIVLPDDLSELADEVARVRHELRWKARRRRCRAGLARVFGKRMVRLPALVVAVATFGLLSGMLSLWYVDGRVGTPHTGRSPRASAAQPEELPALDLLDPGGRAVAVRSLLPAVLLLVEGCACDGLIADTAAAAPDGVSVLVVGASAPTLPASVGDSGKVRPLADPASELRSTLHLPPRTPKAGVLVVAVTAHVVLTLPAVSSVEQFRAGLAQLAHA